MQAFAVKYKTKTLRKRPVKGKKRKTFLSQRISLYKNSEIEPLPKLGQF